MADLIDLADQLAAAVAEETRIKGRVAALREQVLVEMKRLRMRGSLEPTGATVTIVRPDPTPTWEPGFTDWVAQHIPSEAVTQTVTTVRDSYLRKLVELSAKGDPEDELTAEALSFLAFVPREPHLRVELTAETKAKIAAEATS